IPLALELAESDQKLVFLVVLRLNLWTGRLSDNRAYFYVAAAANAGNLDLTIFHLTLPPRQNVEELPDHKDHDGFLDFRNQELVLSGKRKSDGASAAPRPVT